MERVGLFASSLLIGFLSLLTSLINYLTLAILAFFFGAGEKVDAFFAASTLPQILVAALSASITNAFLPFFIERKQQNEELAWAVAGQSFKLLAVILFSLCLIGALFSFPLIRLINPGFSPAVALLASSLFRVLLFSFFFSGCSILLISFHYAYHRFFLPSISQLLNSLITIAFLLLFRFTLGIKSLAFGFLAGSIIQFFLLLPLPLKKSGFSFKSPVPLAELKPLAHLLFPLLAASLFYRANPFVERYFASRLGEGSIAYLGYALRLISALLLLLSQGISIVTFPRMAEQAASGQKEKLNETVNLTLRMMLFLLVPVTFFLLAFRKEIVALLFERGHFSAEATSCVAAALLAYGGYFFLGALAAPVVNVFYSFKKTTLVAMIGLSGFIFFVVLARFLAQKFNFVGLAAASSLQYLVTSSALLILFTQMIKSFPWRKIGTCLLKTALAASLSFGLAMFFKVYLNPWLSFPWSLFFHFLTFSLIYLLLMKLVRAEELELLKKKA
jgi:putative peptidoglycan lipid II flippase